MMEMKEYKVVVKNNEEAEEVRNLFELLGYKKESFHFNCYYPRSVVTQYRYEWLSTGHACDCENGEELTIPQLRDLVVLHRNDVKDANYTYSGKPVLKLDTQDYKAWDSKNNTWTEHVGSQTDLRKGIKPIQPEQGLISGKEALIALANGKEVEIKFNDKDGWHNINKKDAYSFEIFLDPIRTEFRLAPRTITLNIEIPAPFEPKDGDTYWAFHPAFRCGYAESQYLDISKDKHKVRMQFGAWRTEEEIKQVVAALRGALKNG